MMWLLSRDRLANSTCSKLHNVTYQRLRLRSAGLPGVRLGSWSLEVTTVSGKVPRSVKHGRAWSQLRPICTSSETAARRWRDDNENARPAAATSGG